MVIIKDGNILQKMVICNDEISRSISIEFLYGKCKKKKSKNHYGTMYRKYHTLPYTNDVKKRVDFPIS